MLFFSVKSVSERGKVMFDTARAMGMIKQLDFPRECGSDGEAHAMSLIAEELNSLGVKTWYDWFEDSWIAPVDVLLLVGQSVINVKPAVPLPWLPPEFAGIEVSGRLVKPGGPSYRESACCAGTIRAFNSQPFRRFRTSITIRPCV